MFMLVALIAGLLAFTTMGESAALLAMALVAAFLIAALVSLVFEGMTSDALDHRLDYRSGR